MEIVEDRYGTGSTIITSQLPVASWHQVIDEPTFADAILDRLIHKTHRPPLDGQSMGKTINQQQESPTMTATLRTATAFDGKGEH